MTWFKHVLACRPVRRSRIALLALSCALASAPKLSAQSASIEFRVSFNGALGAPTVVDDNGPFDLNLAPGNIDVLIPGMTNGVITLAPGGFISGFKIPGVNGRNIVVSGIVASAEAGAFPPSAGTIDIYACYRFNGPGLAVPAPNVFTKHIDGSFVNGVDGTIDLAGVRYVAAPNGACAVAPPDPGLFSEFVGSGAVPPIFFDDTVVYPMSPTPCVDISTATRLTVFRNGDAVLLPGSASANVVAVADCITGGSGGAIPTSGSGDGSWPGWMPSAPMVSAMYVSVPSGSTALNSVVLRGLDHTWIGDLQVVLQDPWGNQHNILHRAGGGGPGFGCPDDLNGDYTFVDPSQAGTFGNGVWPWTCGGGSGNAGAGTYLQDFGNWPSGANGIYNSAIGSIPIADGTWQLYVYDWAGGDVGALASWELCFDAIGGSITSSDCQIATTPTQGCDSSVSWSGSPSATSSGAFTVNFTGLNAQVNGVVFYGISGPNFVPWSAESYLCATAPTQRVGGVPGAHGNTGGAMGSCNGQYAFDMNAVIQGTALPGALGTPMAAGQAVNLQAWQRDPASSKTTNLTDALNFLVGP